MSSIKILLVEDHELFRLGIMAILSKQAGIELVGYANTGEEAIVLNQVLKPDLVLMDIHLPGLSGVEACVQIVEQGQGTRVLAMSHASDERSIFDMVEAGALGYMLKNSSLEELVRAIRALANGDSYFSKDVSAKLLSGLQQLKRPKSTTATDHLQVLTNREREVLQHVANELSNKEIADKLFISPRTVETHKRNLIQKLKVRNTVGLVKYYMHRIGMPKERTA